MKLIYLFVFITLIVILLLGRSIFSTASDLANSVTSSSSIQTGGKKSRGFLMNIFIVIFAIAVVSYILSPFNK
jgi:hypothetical protein